jgi:hypothetical protein
MTRPANIQLYQEPATQLPGPPTEFNLGGNKYVLVSPEQQAPVVPYQHHQGPVIGGVPYVMTHEGYRPIHQAHSLGYGHGPAPYHAHSAHPPWLRNHYTRGTGILIGAACIGTVIFIVIAALFTLATWALAHLMAIALTVLSIFFGGLILLGKLASARHGHPIRK